MPGAAHKAFSLSTNPNAEARDYIEVLEADEGLSTRVLKIANSVFYDRGGGSRTIVDAVTVVGTTELRNLLNATVLASLFPVRHYLRAELWTHNIAVALTSRLIAQSLYPHQADQAFLAGLMHDVGKLLMLQQHLETYERVIKKGLAEDLDSVSAEVRVYPFDHTHVGQMIAEKWNFSEDLHAAIGGHHAPWASIERGSLAALIKLSDLIAHASSLGAGRDAVAWKRVYAPLLEDAWAYHDVPVREQRRIISEASREFDSEFQLYESWGKS
jgi:putative nucleotidyltransferase with HDIG domain